MVAALWIKRFTGFKALDIDGNPDRAGSIKLDSEVFKIRIRVHIDQI